MRPDIILPVAHKRWDVRQMRHILGSNTSRASATIAGYIGAWRKGFGDIAFLTSLSGLSRMADAMQSSRMGVLLRSDAGLLPELRQAKALGNYHAEEVFDELLRKAGFSTFLVSPTLDTYAKARLGYFPNGTVGISAWELRQEFNWAEVHAFFRAAGLPSAPAPIALSLLLVAAPLSATAAAGVRAPAAAPAPGSAPSRAGAVSSAGGYAADAAARKRTAGCDLRAPSPRVHVLLLPRRFREPKNGVRMAPAFYKRLHDSPHIEPSVLCADYFLLPHFMEKNASKGLDMLEFVARTVPAYNASRDAGEARFLLYLGNDHGPGDSFFKRPISTGKKDTRKQRRYMELRASPADKQRPLAFLVLNGVDDSIRSEETGGFRCKTCFQPGRDIRLPTPPGNNYNNYIIHVYDYDYKRHVLPGNDNDMCSV
ncbi:hypothetical protein T492DRAFT_482924 [Pavlovales sp. CCMP2436]|nr:hypothetical protein T492DRAFT_482924 [Pavlovales sp. CCMP2436]